MPNIAFRFAGGGDFSGLYGAQARGALAGLETARELRKEDLDEADRMRSQREERAAHTFLDEQYAGLEEDEVKREAFSGSPIWLKLKELERSGKEQGLRTAIKGLSSDLEYVGANPRGKAVADRVRAQLQAGGLQAADIGGLSKELSDERRKLAHAKAVEGRAMREMVEAQEWFGTITKPEDYDTDAFELAIGKLAQRLQDSQNPDMEPLSQKELVDLRHEIGKAKIPVDILDRIEHEAAMRNVQDVGRIFQESLSEPDDPDAGRTIEGMSPEEFRSSAFQGPEGDPYARLVGNGPEMAQQGAAQAQPSQNGAPKAAATPAAPPAGQPAPTSSSAVLPSAERLRAGSDKPITLNHAMIVQAHGFQAPEFRNLVSEAIEVFNAEGVEGMVRALARSGVRASGETIRELERIARSGGLPQHEGTQITAETGKSDVQYKGPRRR